MQSALAQDRINAAILRELQKNAKLPNAELAERVGLSPSACLRRVQELERRGVIRGYRAIIDREATGAGFVVYVAVGLNNHTKEALEAFESAMKLAPEVVECHNTTGTIEYLLRVEVADLAEYKSFHTDRLGTHPEVHALTSYVVMDSPKDPFA